MTPEEVRQAWAERDGEFSPRYYAYRGPDATSDRICDVLDESLPVPPAEATVLELGCSAGRHLERLRRAGYADLHGLDLNADAFDVLAETYPDLAEMLTAHVGAMETVLPDLATDSFDAVVSVETLQHVHPDDERVFDDIVRVTDGLLVTVENERSAGDANDETDDETDDETGRDGPDASTQTTGRDASDSDRDPDRPATPTEITQVREDVPLYHRDWGAVFGARGCEQVAVVDCGRDTLRAFRVE